MCLYIHTYTHHTYIYIYTYTHTYICVYTYIHTHIIHTYIYVCIYIYIHTHTHTHIYTPLYTCKTDSFCSLLGLTHTPIPTLATHFYRSSINLGWWQRLKILCWQMGTVQPEMARHVCSSARITSQNKNLRISRIYYIMKVVDKVFWFFFFPVFRRE